MNGKIGLLPALYFALLAIVPGLARAETKPLYFVVNAHGRQTARDFVLPARLSVFTPADLASSYAYSDDNRDPKGIERIFASGRLPAFEVMTSMAGWRRYASGAVRDVELAPLNFSTDLEPGETGVTRELQYLKQRMNGNRDHWAFDTGADSVLVVKRAAGAERIVGHAAIKAFMDAYSVPAASYVAVDAPVVLFVPKENKVKVLARTSLREVALLLDETFARAAPIRLLMAACNDDGTNPAEIILSTATDRATPIAQVFP